MLYNVVRLGNQVKKYLNVDQIKNTLVKQPVGLKRFVEKITLLMTYITIAEFFIILPHGPNCCMGEGAFRDLVLLKQTNKTPLVLAFKNNYSSKVGKDLEQILNPEKLLQKSKEVNLIPTSLGFISAILHLQQKVNENIICKTNTTQKNLDSNSTNIVKSLVNHMTFEIIGVI